MDPTIAIANAEVLLLDAIEQSDFELEMAAIPQEERERLLESAFRSALHDYTMRGRWVETTERKN